LQGVAAVTGGALGARTGLNPRADSRGIKPLIKPRNIALRGGIGALGGMAVGKLTNMAIASANRPKYPSTYEYTQNQ
jgi:hypothetical protein